MMRNNAKPDDTDRANQEAAVLEKYSLRWAVLAAWHKDLMARNSAIAAEVVTNLETAKIKISSGCFSPCEVGCDLRSIEAALTAADASARDSQVDKWLDVLARSMDDSVDSEELLGMQTIRVQFNSCRARGCNCGA